MPVLPVFLGVGRISWREYCLPTDLILRSVEGTTVWVLTPKIIPASIAEIIVPLIVVGQIDPSCPSPRVSPLPRARMAIVSSLIPPKIPTVTAHLRNLPEFNSPSERLN
jgi:hypothetical protein